MCHDGAAALIHRHVVQVASRKVVLDTARLQITRGLRLHQFMHALTGAVTNTISDPFVWYETTEVCGLNAGQCHKTCVMSYPSARI